MRIPHWQAELKPQPTDLVEAIRARRGGKLLNLDHVLLWSEPIARGWNIFMKNVRRDLSASAKQRELAICTVALLTGAHYEYHHHAPEFLAAGGQQAELDALAQAVKTNPRQPVTQAGLGPLERLVVQFAAQMTLDVKPRPLRATPTPLQHHRTGRTHHHHRQLQHGRPHPRRPRRNA